MPPLPPLRPVRFPRRHIWTRIRRTGTAHTQHTISRSQSPRIALHIYVACLFHPPLICLLPLLLLIVAIDPSDEPRNFAMKRTITPRTRHKSMKKKGHTQQRTGEDESREQARWWAKRWENIMTQAERTRRTPPKTRPRTRIFLLASFSTSHKYSKHARICILRPVAATFGQAVDNHEGEK